MKLEDILGAIPSRRIEDILAAIPSKDDLAQIVGLQTRPAPGSELAGAFGIFGAGLVIGAGLALLFAPKVGSELRQDLTQRGQDLAGKVTDKVGELSDRLSASGPSVHPGNGS